MADFASKTRLYGIPRGFKGRYYEPIGQAASSNQQLRQEEWWFSGCVSNAAIASSSCSHSCRSTIMEDQRDLHLFESVIMTNCMRKINNELVRNYREKTIEEQLTEKHPPFLFEIARRGSGEGEVLFPRSVSCCLTGDIAVADSDNNRIQIYNGYGIWKDTIDCGGRLFNHPTTIAMSANQNVPKLGAVVDLSTNVYIVNIERLVKVFQINVGYQPATVGWTVSGYLLCVRPQYVPGKMTVDIFGLSKDDTKGIASPCLTINVDSPFPARRAKPFSPIIQPYYGDPNCFLIGQRNNECIACVNLRTKRVQFRCQIKPPFDGLAVDMVDFSTDSDCPNILLIADQYNRFLLSCEMVPDAKTRSATLLPTTVICRPRDGIGQVRRCAVSPWGHAISCEYGQDYETEMEVAKSRDKSSMSLHRLTVFRVPYRQCHCHDWQPVKQHLMDSTITTPSTRGSGATSPRPEKPLPWQRNDGFLGEEETRYLDMNRRITPDPVDNTPEPAVLVDEIVQTPAGTVSETADQSRSQVVSAAFVDGRTPTSEALVTSDEAAPPSTAATTEGTNLSINNEPTTLNVGTNKEISNLGDNNNNNNNNNEQPPVQLLEREKPLEEPSQPQPPSSDEPAPPPPPPVVVVKQEDEPKTVIIIDPAHIRSRPTTPALSKIQEDTTPPAKPISRPTTPAASVPTITISRPTTPGKNSNSNKPSSRVASGNKKDAAANT